MAGSTGVRISTLVALGLATHVLAYSPGTGSFVAGDLSIAAPYGIPPEEFGIVTERILSKATFNMTGYNVSINTSPREDPGWTLTVDVTTDVSLLSAADSSPFDIEATTLSIEPPGGNATIDPSWSICAVVYTGLRNGAVSRSATIDGTCEDILSSDCIQAIEGGSSGIGDDGSCTTYTLPPACEIYFPDEYINTTAFAINQTVLDNRRFYAFGSPPTQTANVSAYEQAIWNVWPVVTLFSHMSESGTVESLNTTIQCVRATNGTTRAPSNSESSARKFRIPTLLDTSAGLLISLFGSWLMLG